MFRAFVSQKKHCIAQIVCILEEIWEAGIGVRSQKRKRKKGGRDVCVMIIRDDPILSGEEGGKEKEGGSVFEYYYREEEGEEEGWKISSHSHADADIVETRGGREEKAIKLIGRAGVIPPNILLTFPSQQSILFPPPVIAKWKQQTDPSSCSCNNRSNSGEMEKLARGMVRRQRNNYSPPKASFSQF